MGDSEKTAAPLLLLLLPRDILVEILTKFPAKSLVQFRCISKFFCALIDGHGFGVVHRSLSLTLPSRAGILIAITPRKLFSARCSPAYYTLNFGEENPRRPGMLQANRLAYLDNAEPFGKGSLRSSSDGLICVYRPNEGVFVCNVSTGQLISLPTVQSHSPYLFSSCALLGFDSLSKRYKVLMIDSFEYKHCVFTVGVDRSWREINYSLSHPFYPFDAYACPSYSDTSVHIDGVIYSFNWLTKDDPPNFHIVAFDVGSERYSLIPFPVEISSSSSQYQCDIFVLGNFALLQVDGGRLAIVYVHKIGHLFYMDVWTLEKSKGCSWEKITTVIPFHLIVEQSMRSIEHLPYTTNHAGDIVLLCTHTKQFSILVCNLKSKVWRKFNVGGVKEFPICYPTDVRMYRTMDNVFSIE
nr:putative F-box protein At3g52320 [Ipomoea batatas]